MSILLLFMVLLSLLLLALLRQRGRWMYFGHTVELMMWSNRTQHVRPKNILTLICLFNFLFSQTLLGDISFSQGC